MAFNRLTLLLLIFLHSHTIKGQGHTKVWIPKDRFLTSGKEDPECINQTFIYQSFGGLFFTIPDDVNEIILPSQGAIIFQQNQEIKFRPRQLKCHTDNYNTNHFRLHTSRASSWFDTSNWRIKDTATQNKAIPHIDRIPCECDVIEFTTDRSLWIDMEYNPQMTVKQVIINNKTDDLNGFLGTHLGQLMFMYERSEGMFEEGLCEREIKTCGCHQPSKFADYLDLVCLNSDVCHEPGCLDPIQPIGHCCPICGGMLEITVDEGFCNPDFRSMNEYTDIYVLTQKEYAGKVDAYIGLVRGEHDKDIRFQMIAVDKGDFEGLSVDMIKSTEEKYFSMKKKHGLCIVHATTNFLMKFNLFAVPNMVLSGPPYVKGSFSIWFIIFSSLLMVLSMYGTIYFYYSEDSKLRKYNPFNRLRLFTSPFVFARFDNTRDDDTQSIAVGVEFEESHPSTSIYETIASAFDNPMFRGRNKEKKIETIGPNVLNESADDDGESVASVKLVEVELDSNEES